MATGIQNSGGADFDSLFEQRITGDPKYPNSTGLQHTNGTPLEDIFVPLSFSGSPISSNTGVQASNGVDCRNIFAAKGTVTRVFAPWNGKSYSADSFTPAGGLATSEIIFTLHPSNNFSVGGTVQQQGTVSNDSGVWLTNESASLFQVRYTPSISGSYDVLEYPTGWNTLSTDRSVRLMASAIGSTVKMAGGNVTVEIRRASTQQIVSTSSFYMGITVEH